MSGLRFACLPLVALLGACSEPMITNESPRTLYVESIYTYGAADRDLQLVVTGNPFGIPDGAFQQAVERGLEGQGSILQPATRPRLHPDSSARPGYRLVLAFQPPDAGDAADLCGDRKGTDRVGKTVEVDAAFCVMNHGESIAYSYTTGRVDASGPDDPGFKALLDQVMLSVFHQDQPFDNSGGDNGSSTP